MPAVPPTTTVQPSVDISDLLEALPGVHPAVCLPGRRLRSLCFDPANPFTAVVPEAVDRPDPGEDHVVGAQGVALAVELGLDLTGQEDVGLLEGMVVRLGGT